MKTEIITIILVMFSCVLLPFTLLIINNFLDEKMLKKKSATEAKRLKINSIFKEKWKHTILGIDPLQKKLLFVQKRNNCFCIEYIDLEHVKEIRLNEVSFQSRKYKNKEALLQRIDLELVLDSNERSRILNLFDSILDTYTVMEVSHARQWNSLIQNHMGKAA